MQKVDCQYDGAKVRARPWPLTQEEIDEELAKLDPEGGGLGRARAWKEPAEAAEATGLD